MKNTVEICGDTACLVIPRRDGTIYRAIIDRDDLELVSGVDGRWYTHVQRRKVYVFGHDASRRPMYLHRFITGATAGYVVDHINHDGLDNRRNNLRVCSPSVNQHNRSGLNANNTSGVLGVSWDSTSKAWRVFVGRDGRNYHIGSFPRLDEAALAAQRARRELSAT